MKYLLSEHVRRLTKHGTSDIELPVLLEACDANEGSLYHFFLAGNEELVVAAVEYMADTATAQLSKRLESSDQVRDAIYKHVMTLAKCVK